MNTTTARLMNEVTYTLLPSGLTATEAAPSRPSVPLQPAGPFPVLPILPAGVRGPFAAPHAIPFLGVRMRDLGD